MCLAFAKDKQLVRLLLAEAKKLMQLVAVKAE